MVLENESDMEDDEDLDIYEDDEDDEDIEFVEDDGQDIAGKMGAADNSFVDFVNPVKTVPVGKQQPLAAAPQAQQPAFVLPQQQPFGGDFGGMMMQEPEETMAPPVLPSEGYATIEDEKTDLLIKLDRMKRKGLTAKTFDVHGDIIELRSEVARIRSEAELENSIQFSQRMLVAAVSLIEWGNKKYDPFDLYLDGWSMSIADNVNSFDSVLEKLYFKYRNKIAMPPEMELMMSLAGSAFMFHMTNSMFKKIMPNAQKPNPDMLRSMMSAFAGGPKSTAPPPATMPQPPFPSAPPVAKDIASNKPQEQAKSEPAPYQMKGPGLDLGPMMSLVGSMGLPSDFMKPPEVTRPIVESRPPPPPPMIQQQPPPPPPAFPVAPTTVLDARIAEDRLSDIISEDLESITGLSDMSSVSSGSKSSVRKVDLKGTSTAKKRGRKAAPVVGKVMLI